METTLFSNVTSAIRRELLARFPFADDLVMSEDQEWAARVLLAGYRLVYEPRSRVVHSHNRSMWGELKRVYLDHQNLHRLFGVHTVPRARDVAWCTAAYARHLVGVVARDPSLGPGARLRWWAAALPYAFTQNLAQFLGARSVEGIARGRPLARALDRVLGRGI
jgi:hypothetical protein